MKKLCLVILVALIGCEPALETNPTESAKKAVLAEWTGLWDAYAAMDFEGMLSHYEEDFLHLNGGDVYPGEERLRGAWETFEDTQMEIVKLGQPKFFMASDNIVTYNKYYELYITDGDTAHIKGMWTAVWKKQPNGDWKVTMATWDSERINQDE